MCQQLEVTEAYFACLCLFGVGNFKYQGKGCACAGDVFCGVFLAEQNMEASVVFYGDIVLRFGGKFGILDTGQNQRGIIPFCNQTSEAVTGVLGKIDGNFYG